MLGGLGGVEYICGSMMESPDVEEGARKELRSPTVKLCGMLPTRSPSLAYDATLRSLRSILSLIF